MARLIRGLAVLYLLAVAFFSWGWLAVKLEVFPYSQLQPLYADLHAFFAESHRDNVGDIIKYDHQERKSGFDFSGLQRRDDTFADDGYLLVSRYSKGDRQTVVELHSLASGEVLHKWVPDLAAIFALSPSFNTGVNTRAAYRSQHPLLLDNGDLVIGSGEGPLARIDACGRPVWVIERHFHHSIELDGDGNLLVPVALGEGPNDLGVAMRDDGFAVVSTAGEVLREFSLYQALMAGGYRGLIYGVGEFEHDRFHLNDVQPVPGNPELVLLSIRNLSAIAEFNLRTGVINWLKSGPWLNQHDVNVLDDGWISVFGNDFARGANTLMAAGHSEIYLYHPQSGEIATPYTAVLAAADMRTEYEGRARVLANGDAFIEETNRDRMLRVSRDTMRWEFVNGVTATSTGALHWSRYLDSSQVTPQLRDHLTCVSP